MPISHFSSYSTSLHHLLLLLLIANRCTDSVLTSLTCSKLKSIELAANGDVTLEGIKSLSRLACSQLQCLGLSCCVGVRREHKQFFHCLPSLFPFLKSLDLW